MMNRRVVVKLGTTFLTNGTKQLYRPNMVEIARECAQLQQQGWEVILVSSGAVAAGRQQLGYPTLPSTITSKQLLAAVGQNQLMQLWSQLFHIYGVNVGQILLTRADVESRPRYLNARETLNALLEQKIVPIINENDAIATEEIKVGDNDNLSALVAVLAEAELLLLLTDQQGLFTADPRQNPHAQLISEVGQITPELRQLAGGSVTGLGTGGMATKLEAAEIATRTGVTVIIANGRLPNIIVRLVSGEAIGTKFTPRATSVENRQRWLLAGSRPVGSVVIDAGAKAALCEQGRSLLPAGIVAVEGVFARGDTVAIVDESGHEWARGLVRYPSEALEQIKRKNSAEIEPILGYTYGKVAIHRNDMIIR